MRSFRCPRCDAQLYFENSVCVSCGSAVGYDRDQRSLVLVDRGAATGRAICANLDLNGCNWLADPASEAGFCLSCRLTRTRPADADLAGLADYYVAESAKRWLVFELDELGLPVVVSDGFTGLAFDLLSSDRSPVTTGYLNGVITFDLAETHDAHRENLRVSMAEPYRTVLGHFRHEIGHYYCELLVLTAGRTDEFRELFGDETRSYADALADHYRAGPGGDWPTDMISSYAAMHPLEDFAETFAHFLHITDTLQTASEFGVTVGPTGPDRPFATVVAEDWLPLSRALNQINKSLGKGELYPFVLTDPVIAKLDFVSRVVRAA
ncbi:MAG TPA: putative zinc-binding metallopeptidase [Microlunatus sp.]|nr:putative zinc-binding metallopeptidase [Microlunatus sp.]